MGERTGGPTRSAEPDRLGQLLRSRRERLRPEDVGLPSGARRRTPGLRREEVALLADVSATYYTFLEQGRAMRPSRQVLDALARALRLTPAERDHLNTLADGGVADTNAVVVEQVQSGVRDLVARLDPHPTYVTGRRWDVLAANRSARALFTDWPARPREERNMLRWMFADAAARHVYVEWDKEASALLARFRSSAARWPADPDFLALIDSLHRDSAEVREWWPRHEVVPLGSGDKRLRHPVLGEFTLTHVVLLVADHPEQKLVTFSSPDGDTELLAALFAGGPEEAG